MSRPGMFIAMMLAIFLADYFPPHEGIQFAYDAWFGMAIWLLVEKYVPLTERG